VITNALGCRDTIIKDIEVKERFLVPNVFTPNNDGINDVFNVIASGYTNFNMKILNRWGDVLFETNNINNGWNGRTLSGTLVSEGTYFYIIQLTSPRGEQIIEKGPLQLLR
ncbi:MAG: gliding motility-associated C-terminal domain-containing protein, partial [Bacteroidia bacterium]